MACVPLAAHTPWFAERLLVLSLLKASCMPQTGPTLGKDLSLSLGSIVEKFFAFAQTIQNIQTSPASGPGEPQDTVKGSSSRRRTRSHSAGYFYKRCSSYGCTKPACESDPSLTIPRTARTLGIKLAPYDNPKCYP